VSITDLVFGGDFTKAIENKQIAQQQAERAKFIVERAEQEKKQVLIKAKGEALAAEYFGKALKESPAYIDIKRIEAAKEIAKNLGRSNNKVYLDSETLLLNLTHGLDQNLESKARQ
jgi:prohibitin 2